MMASMELTDEGSGPADLVHEAWRCLVDGSGGDRSTARPRLLVQGVPGSLVSRFRVEDVAVACVGAALMAGVELKVAAGGKANVAVLDRSHVSACVRSERYFRRSGRPEGAGFAPLSRFWQAADGWVRTHANYPWHREALLRALGTSEDVGAVAARIVRTPSVEVEDRVFEMGGIAAGVRSKDEWDRHPQGEALASEPLVSHVALGDCDPRSAILGALPASGVRVLDLTRVIAGPVCTRFLGAMGAEVLRVDPPSRADMAPGSVADTLLAKRSCALELDDEHHLAHLHELLGEADALVCGYRPRSLDRFGLSEPELVERHPGLVVVYLAAWGHSGPWETRRGFDSVVQGPTGLALGESSDCSTPGALPCQMLDHGTGYLAAAAVLDGLRRQRTEGATHFRRLSLARTARWIASNPAAAHPNDFGHEPGPEPPESWLVELGADRQSVQAIAPPGALDAEPLEWPGPPSRYMADRAAWGG